jgi:hypothetical protein
VTSWTTQCRFHTLILKEQPGNGNTAIPLGESCIRDTCDEQERARKRERKRKRKRERERETKDLTALYIGGPTALFEWDGFRLLIDPTFDEPGCEYKTGPVVLEKTAGPAVSSDSLGPVDVVRLSHDHQFDNLDHAGRQYLPQAKCVITTTEGAARLGGNAIGLLPWGEREHPGK